MREGSKRDGGGGRGGEGEDVTERWGIDEDEEQVGDMCVRAGAGEKEKGRKRRHDRTPHTLPPPPAPAATHLYACMASRFCPHEWNRSPASTMWKANLRTEGCRRHSSE
jgi:hypothetical protein